MNQPNLFSLARNSDPETSHIAAEAIKQKLGTLQKGMLDAIRDANSKGVEPTSEEAARIACLANGGSKDSYRKRVGELERMGYIVHTGKKRCPVTRHQARTFKAVK